MSYFKNRRVARTLSLVSMLLLVPLVGCQVEKEQSGSLPDVDVDVEAGSLPKYDIDGPDVKVGVRQETVTVPKVIVVQEEETVEVPYIDVDLPGAEREERTITSEIEVPSIGYDLNIQEIYVVNDEIWVVSQLSEIDPDAQEAIVRVSDRVVLNAPDMSVRQYIIGERPEGNYNEQYTFINGRQDIASELEAGRQIYGQEQASL
ncbi:MAG: hypothetical protein ACFBSC_15355 [Microcoleaceae cyanobacterium]